MSVGLFLQIYSISFEEQDCPAVEVKLFKQADGSFSALDGQKFELCEGYIYDVFLVYTPSNSSLSLQISNDAGLLIRFGGVVSSTIGLGTTVAGAGKQVEIIFQLEKGDL